MSCKVSFPVKTRQPIQIFEAAVCYVPYSINCVTDYSSISMSRTLVCVMRKSDLEAATSLQ